MSIAIPFDTLSYAKFLKEAGIDDRVAEAHAQANAMLISSLMEGILASKSDVKNLENRMENRFQEMEHHMENRFQEMEHRVKEVESNLTIRFGIMLASALAIFSTLVTVLHLLH